MTSLTLSGHSTVFFCKKTATDASGVEDHTQKPHQRPSDNDSPLGRSSSDTSVSSPIFDVLDTHRPPDLPSQWLYPPGRLGSFSWVNVKGIGKGHANFANTCFLNATVQSLAYCVPFAEDCLNGRHSARCVRREQKQVCGFCHFERHLRHLLSSERPNESIARWHPTLLQLMKKEIRMNQGYGGWYGAQNCAHEWLVQFLDFLIKYDLPPHLQKDFEHGRLRLPDLATSYLHQLFSGCIEESKICQSCNKASTRYELNTCFRVPLHGSRSVVKALRATFEPELLTGSNRPLCEGCGVPRDKAARRAIQRPPNILVLLLQRTEFDTHFSLLQRSSRGQRHVRKNCVPMEVPVKLTLDPYMSESGRRSLETNHPEDNHYDFIASVNHSGTAGFGHYWAIVKGPDGLFYKLDDEHRSRVPSSMLSDQLASGYLLFYLRRKPVKLRNVNASSLSSAHSTVAPPVATPWTMDLYAASSTDGTTVASTPESASIILNSERSPTGVPESTDTADTVELSSRSDLGTGPLEIEEHEKEESMSTISSTFPLQMRRMEPSRASRTSRWWTLWRQGGLRRLLRAVVYSQALKFRRRLDIINKRHPTASTVQDSFPNPTMHSIVDQSKDEEDSDGTTGSVTIPLLDVASGPELSAPMKKGSKKFRPFNSEKRLKKGNDVTSQYGYQAPSVDFWETNKDTDDRTGLESASSLRSRMEAIQACLVPQSSRRSREDQEYDRGRKKKVKGAQEPSSFDFAEALRTSKPHLRPSFLKKKNAAKRNNKRRL